MRHEPDPEGTEKDLLLAYLQYQRETVLTKVEGLSQAELSRHHPPSGLTLAGLLFHLALVEESWMEVRFAGQPAREPWVGVDWDADPDWEFRTARAMDPLDLVARYRDASRRADEVAALSDAGQLSAEPLRDGRHFSLRWVLLHLIEETARHAGHADLIREAIDGATGE